MAESTVEEQQVISRLMDYLDSKNEKIEWDRRGWKEDCDYTGDELTGKLDTDFAQSQYTALFWYDRIGLEYRIGWEEGGSSFSIWFSEHTRIGINPQPEQIVLFKSNPYSEEKESKGHLPIFQARYPGSWFTEFDEAFVAMHDFADNGQRLVDYFVNMREESVKEYIALVQKFKQFRDLEKEVVRLG